MGLFCVWLKIYNKQYPRVSQQLITFLNREAADEWWRTISTPPSIYAGDVKRMSPQLYVQIDEGDVFYSFNTGRSPAARHLSDTMFSPCTVDDHANNPITITLPSEVTDHISGRWYFIRSKADSFSHWYLRTSGTCAVCGDANCGAIHVSSDCRTRFCVQVRNNPEVPEDFVMIGKDEISIVAPKGCSVHIDDAGDLKATKGYQGETDMLFGDLRKRFVTRAEKQVNGEIWEYVESVERGVGEIWELVE